MKKNILLVSLVFMMGVLFGCSAADTPDYTTSEFEEALNRGEDPTGKTVSVKVIKLVPNSTFGYNMQAGEHLNFISSTNPGVKAGDTIVVKVEKVTSMLGSYLINYSK